MLTSLKAGTVMITASMSSISGTANVSVTSADFKHHRGRAESFVDVRRHGTTDRDGRVFRQHHAATDNAGRVAEFGSDLSRRSERHRFADGVEGGDGDDHRDVEFSRGYGGSAS